MLLHIPGHLDRLSLTLGTLWADGNVHLPILARGAAIAPVLCANKGTWLWLLSYCHVDKSHEPLAGMFASGTLCGNEDYVAAVQLVRMTPSLAFRSRSRRVSQFPGAEVSASWF